MSQKSESNKERCGCACCLNRREFLAAGGASLAAWQLGASSLSEATAAERPRPDGNPRVQVAFVRPDVDRFTFNWPGVSYDIQARQADYTKTLTDAAKDLRVQLDIRPKPVSDQESMAAYLKEVKTKRPDGVVLVSQCLSMPQAFIYWTVVQQFLRDRGDVPTVVFSPMGTSFLRQIQQTQKEAEGTRAFIASTQDVNWLADGLRMLNTIWHMKQTRICVVQGNEPADVVLDTIGTTLHYVRSSRFSEEYGKVQETDEVRTIANHYTKHARKIVEPTDRDIMEAAKIYVVCRRLMDEEGCHGIAVDCLPIVESRSAPPPCMAFSRLNDEGITAACQADWPAAISLRLTYLLLNRPGFMQNIAVNTVNNTLMGAHCTSPTRLAGPDQPPAPFVLRSHAEADIGVAMQVLWPGDEPITIMKFSNPLWWSGKPTPDGSLASSIVLGSGRVVCNIDTPPSGGCRTSLEVALDGIEDVRDLKALHHQLFILGDHTRTFKAYGELAGIDVSSI